MYSFENIVRVTGSLSRKMHTNVKNVLRTAEDQSRMTGKESLISSLVKSRPLVITKQVALSWPDPEMRIWNAVVVQPQVFLVKECSLGIRRLLLWQCTIHQDLLLDYLWFLHIFAGRTIKEYVKCTGAHLNLSKSAVYRNCRNVKHKKKCKLLLMIAQKRADRQTVSPWVTVALRSQDLWLLSTSQEQHLAHLFGSQSQ